MNPTSWISGNLSWMFLEEGEMRPGILLSTKPATFSKGKELMPLLFPFSKTLCGDGFAEYLQKPTHQQSAISRWLAT